MKIVLEEVRKPEKVRLNRKVGSEFFWKENYYIKLYSLFHVKAGNTSILAKDKNENPFNFLLVSVY